MLYIRILNFVTYVTVTVVVLFLLLVSNQNVVFNESVIIMCLVLSLFFLLKEKRDKKL